MVERISLPSGEIVEFPDGTPTDVMERALAEHVRNPAPQRSPASSRSTGEVAANGAGLFGRGFNDVLADVVGAPVDLANAGMRAVGLPASQDPFGGSASVRRGIRGITDIAGAPSLPDSTAERLAYGAGRGVGEAAAVALPAAALARTARAGTLAAGVGESLAAQPVLQGVGGAAAGATTEATENPWLGLAAGLAVPLGAGAARRAASPVQNTLNAERQRLAAVARQEGLDLTPGQATGSRTLLGTESVLGELPWTSGTRQAEIAAQQSAYNRAVLSRAGVNADSASPQVLADARTALGQEFADLTSRNALDANGGRFLNDLAALDGNLADASDDVAARVRGLTTEFLSHADQQTMQVSGEFYQRFQSRLSRIIRENTNNPELSGRVRELRDAVRQGMDSSITPEDAAAWRQATRRYANLKVIEDAAGSGSNAATAGNVTGNSLAQAINRSTGRGFAMGRGDLNDLARVGQQFVRDPVANSGTAQRTMLMNAVRGGGIPAALGVGTATMASLPTAALAGGVALTLPKAIQVAYNSRAARSYLTNQLARNYRARRSVPGVAAAEALRQRERGDD